MRTFVLIFILINSLSLYGSCGLENCKNPAITKRLKNNWALDLSSVFTDFTYGKKDGYYYETDLRLSFISRHDWMVDLKLPYISFHYDDKETSGYGNPVLAFEKWFSHDRFSPLFGLQLELPLGEEDKGIAPDHYEVLPYVGVGFASGSYFLRLVSGYRFSISDSQDSNITTTTSDKKFHAGHIDPNAPLTLAGLGPVVVNFHAEEEIQFFLSGGKGFFDNKFVIGFQSVFRQATAGEDKLMLIYGGPSLQYSNRLFRLTSQANFPLSSDKKMNWNFGLNLTFDF